MSKETYRQIEKDADRRQNLLELNEINELTGVYEGDLPPKYLKFFPKKSPHIIVNMTRLAWDDLASDVGRWPDLIADPLNGSDVELARTDKLEKIGSHYIQNSYPSGKQFLWQLAWWTVGTGRHCAIVIPDHKNKTPRFEIRDPRHAFPGPKRQVGNQIVELDDMIFKYTITYDEAFRQGLAPENDTRQTLSATYVPTREGRKGDVTIVEKLDRQAWTVVSEFGIQKSALHGLGMVPAVYQRHFAPNKNAVGQFDDQITIQVAISRMMSQKMAFADRLLYPVTWVKGHEGNIKLGPLTLNKLGPDGAMGQLSPPTQLQVDRDIATLERFSRILNRNPEVRQGEVDGKGAYVGSKTLESLNESIDVTVDSYWDLCSVSIQTLMQAALKMDESLWPNEKKSLHGIKDGNRYRDSYIPAKDINGRHFLRVEYGFARGGYTSFLETVQGHQSGLLPKRRAVEQLPGTSDANDILRELEIEELDLVQKAAFMAEAQNGTMDVVVVSEIRKLMEEKGMSLHTAVLEMKDKLQKQAAVAETTPDIGGLTSPEPAPQGGPGPGPSLPPAEFLGV